MLFSRMLCAYGILVSLSLFISLNIKDILQGGGYLYLVTTITPFGVLVLLSKDVGTLLRLRKAALFLLVFVTYFAVKFYFESDLDTYETKQVTIATSHGILFAFGLGFACAYALATIYELRLNPVTYSLSGYLGIAYLLLVFAISWDAYSTHVGTIRYDLFLIQDDSGYYQRVGGLVFTQIILATSLSLVILNTLRRVSLLRILPAISLLLGTAAVCALTAQMVGSNSGFVSTAVFLFLYLSQVAIIYFKGIPSSSQRIGMFRILASPLGRRLLMGAAAAAVVIVLLGAVTIIHMQLDIYTLRIMGFGEGELVSATSREEIFKENFLDHFFYANPLFGNTQVEKHTTGDGTYVHSLLSILTHLGLIGFMLFIVMLYYLYTEITSPKRANSNSIYCSQPYSLFRLLGLGAVLVMALASAFLTWTPLWFALGLFGAWYHERRIIWPKVVSLHPATAMRPPPRLATTRKFRR